MQVMKRNGTIVPFDLQKIVHAITQAFMEVYGCLTIENIVTINNISEEIVNTFQSNHIDLVSVETIQDAVEMKLIQSEHPEVAKAYIIYRNQHAMARNDYEEIISLMEEKLKATNIQNQNANVDEASFGGRIGEMSSALTKKYALDYLVSPMAKENHLGNMIYIHDLDAYAVGSHNCLSIPFDDLLAKGFNTRQTDIRPANSINTAFQLVAVIFQLQSLQQFGGVSATHIDWTMVPYVRKSFYKHYLDGVKYCQDGKLIGLGGWFEEFDLTGVKEEWIASEASIEDPVFVRNERAYCYAMDMTTKEIYQAVEAMYHNLK